MSLRILLGGVASSFVENNLHQQLESGTFIAFGPGTALGPADSWDALSIASVSYQAVFTFFCFSTM